MSARGSDSAPSSACTRMSAPISRRMSSRAVRVGLMPTSRMSERRRSRRSCRRPMKNAAEEKSPGMRMSVARSVAGPWIETAPASRSDRHAEGAEHPLRMVPRDAGFLHAGAAACVETGQQERRLDLRARHVEWVVAARRAGATADGDRRPAVVGRDVGAHASQGRGDPLHWPPASTTRRRRASTRTPVPPECRRAVASTCPNCRDRARRAGARSPRMPTPVDRRVARDRVARAARPSPTARASVEAQSSRLQESVDLGRALCDCAEHAPRGARSTCRRGPAPRR